MVTETSDEAYGDSVWTQPSPPSIVILRLDRRIGFKSRAVDLKPLILLALRASLVIFTALDGLSVTAVYS